MRKPSFQEPLESQIDLRFCEKVDDDINILFGSYLDGIELEEYEIFDYIERIKKFLVPGNVQLTPKMEIISSNQKVKKEEKLTRYEYVCPRCFETINHCTCCSYPYFLIQIDKNILPIVKNLNIKGYYTASSCEGHEENSVRSTHIIFQQKYKFPTEFPSGGHYNAQAILRYRYPKCGIDEFKSAKQNI